ncbi:hypothetical protein Pcinc_042157 [Petrolisthes cinctipes]|uniref:Hexosyltransferase n=1 Tax=Petrolisthes cinctipes TaxID=88211 RepID=A0AAE1BIK3_PETCI|nr:hypothetical protein Pcinc_042157 [Petrolisthes cinctipes]
MVWVGGQRGIPPPPTSPPHPQRHRRPPPRGPPYLYPPPTPLLDLPTVSLLGNTAICPQHPLLLLILVISHPAHTALRNTHRAHVPPQALEALGARRVFIVGDGTIGQKEYPAVDVSEVLKEASKERDLVVSDLKEHYRNLTYKHALALSWSASFCASATFLLKMDDDIMVDVWGVAHLLRAGLTLGPDGTLQTRGEGRLLNPSEAWTAGLLQKDLQPQREGGKWRVTPSEYPGHRYPDFLAGWAYLATRSAAKALVKAAAAASTPPFWIDDVYMTGMLATVAGIPRYSLNQYYSLMSSAASCCLQAPPYPSLLPQPQHTHDLAPPTSPLLPQPQHTHDIAPPTSSSLPQPQHTHDIAPPTSLSLPQPQHTHDLAPPTSPSLPQLLAPPSLHQPQRTPSLHQPQHPPSLHQPQHPTSPSLPQHLAPPSLYQPQHPPSLHQPEHPQALLAPICGLLVAPSDKNLTLMEAWLEAAKVCHERGSCPTTTPHLLHLHTPTARRWNCHYDQLTRTD